MARKTYVKICQVQEIAKRIRKLAQLIIVKLQRNKKKEIDNICKNRALFPTFQDSSLDSTYRQPLQLGKLDQRLRKFFELIPFKLKKCAIFFL